MSLTTLEDFADVIEPILKAGTWTNYNALNNNQDPKIIVFNKGDPKYGTLRGNKNGYIGIRNTMDEPPELAMDGTLLFQNLGGEIACVSTKNEDRNAMKADVLNILKASGIPFNLGPPLNNPKIRNKETSIFSITIIKC
ncbi:MAG: hypothetical protein ACTSX4_11950 [Candidatus Helarchaeota archaeon]